MSGVTEVGGTRPANSPTNNAGLDLTDSPPHTGSLLLGCGPKAPPAKRNGVQALSPRVQAGT